MSSENQFGRGDGAETGTVARLGKRSLAVAIAFIVTIAAAGILLFVGSRSQTRMINCPFADVVSCFCGALHADLTQSGKRTTIWGPKFLDTGTQYFVDTSVFLPDQELRFRAWYYQIGGEDNAFIIRRINDRQTEITVDQAIRFLAVFPKCTARERRLLNSIQKELESESQPRGADMKQGRVEP